MQSGSAVGTPPGGRKRISAARRLYLQMMDEIVGPLLVEFGFAHRSGEFRYRSGDYLATIHPRGLHHRPLGEYTFDVEVGVSFVPDGPAWFWRSRLAGLELRPTADRRHEGGLWTVRAGQPAEPVAQELLAMLRTYGWPAIRVLLEDPGPDPREGVGQIVRARQGPRRLGRRPS
jgi:hypothetical protein